MQTEQLDYYTIEFLKEVELSFDMLISDGTQTLQLTNGKATSFSACLEKPLKNKFRNSLN